MHLIQRHKIKHDAAEEIFQTALTGSKKIFERRGKAEADQCLFMCSRLNTVLRFGSIISLDEATKNATLRAYAKLSAAAFEALDRKARVQIFLDDGSPWLEVHGPLEKSMANLGDWIDSIWLNLICDSKSTLQGLCLVPFGKLDKGGTEVSPFAKELRESLVSWILKDDIDKSIELLKAAHEKAIRDKTWTTPITTKFLTALRMTISDPASISEPLADALEAHKQYWSKPHEDEAQGYLSYPLSALATVAKQKTGTSSVQSDYLISLN